MISVSDLHFRYREGEFVLHIPELAVEQGSTAALIGPSGSGKTTLLNLIAGIAVPQKGCIVTNGVEVTSMPDAQRRDFRIANIGLVFQEFELLEYLNVQDNMLLPYRINPSLHLTGPVWERAVQLAEQVGIADKLGRHPSQLSQGERQRVAVCRAVLPEPVLLLADEPTGNLDLANRGRVLDILFDYQQRANATFVTVTHDHDLLPRFARVVDFKAYQEAPTDRPVVAAAHGADAR